MLSIIRFLPIRPIVCVMLAGVWMGACSTDGEQDSNPFAPGSDNNGTTIGNNAQTETEDGGPATDATGNSPTHPDDICDGGRCSYIWIANSGESTLSKVNTFTNKEVARYRTCPGTGPFDCDPSRTSVNLHGDVVVTNRYPTVTPNQDGEPAPETIERSSVTKVAADRGDCIDKNGDGFITTSTGPDDVLPWGDDECMLWNTDLGMLNADAPRARATAWDGSEDPDTGDGGNVLIGTCIAGVNGEWDVVPNNQVYVLDGDTGSILDEIPISNTQCLYGGAMDGESNFWIMDGYGFPKEDGLIRLNLDTRQVTKFEQQCGYGISVDADGNIWTGGKHWWSDPPPSISSCIQKLTPEVPTPTIQVTNIFSDNTWLRGIAVGSGKSAGYVWAAERGGALYRVAQNDLNDVRTIETPAFNTAPYCNSYDTVDCPNALVGVAIDYEGNVWSVSTTQNAAYRYDPETEIFTTVPIGDSPYTYSDMTGMQLKGAIIIE